ncbi:hypothetical protein [Streptomyces spinosisporus]|uniref:Uncharacterized protein n=1 Tax=Streptomyces spinosisporus TaxID=2927582 RepID=A0ABS9XW38_9ACTN|nr:hypothetical protein [Streptomyces spinosisporus]MCI3246284.1 hypothetical protein [Streptomyces spinosisporus]
MRDFDVDEECPHCDEPQPSQQMDAHVAAAHADLPPCTARIDLEGGPTYACAFRAGHDKGEYGKWHASKRGGETWTRYVWNDSALDATPHRPPEPRVVGLDHFKAMGVVSHAVVASGVACAVLHTDDEGNTVPCPGYPHVDEGHPEAPSEEELNTALPVMPDPCQPAYDAVYEYIRALGDYLPPDRVHRNAIIWRAVHAALAATPVGRCVSSHCVEGGHILPVESETP